MPRTIFSWLVLLRSHLGLFCSRDARVHKLVSYKEAYWASCEESQLMSDDEGSAATIAYVQGLKPCTTFKQWQKSAERGACDENTGEAPDHSSPAPRKKTAEAKRTEEEDPHVRVLWSLLLLLWQTGSLHGAG